MRYEAIIDAIKRGVCDEELMDCWEGLTPDTLRVYHKVVDGTLCKMAVTGAHHNAVMSRNSRDAMGKLPGRCTMHKASHGYGVYDADPVYELIGMIVD